MEGLIKGKVVENGNVMQGIRKIYTNPDLKSHTVLTDDVFTYIDFYFKKHNKKLFDANGLCLKQNFIFYWNQSKNFYNATKILPVEASPLPMYYSMLNASKAYMLYCAKDVEDAVGNLKNHGIHEGVVLSQEKVELSNIYVYRTQKGVFSQFSKMLDPNFDEKMKYGKENKYSLKEIIKNLPYVHSAYISTYDLKRREEKFLPMNVGDIPKFCYCNDRKIHLVVELQKKYFKRNAVVIPKEILGQIPEDFEVSQDDAFCLISKKGFHKKDLKDEYEIYRKHFAFISANDRLWYLKKKDFPCDIFDLSATFAITHRLSEIVRYKPEQMVELLKGKENWLIHEFLTMALDHFIDGIACEISKKEIMHTRYK